MKIVYFHRNPSAGYSINKVTQTIISQIPDRTEYYVPFAGAGVLSLIRNIWFIFRHREKGAIHHITGDIHYGLLGLIGCKSVLTIHDTGSIDNASHPWLKAKILEYFWFRLPLVLADRVICISQETKRRLQKYTKRSDIQVVYNAVDPSIKSTPLQTLTSPVKILIVGTAPNKNVLRTIRALRGVDCTVVIIGELNQELLDCLNNNEIRYENRVKLTNSQINQEYANCDLVSFCSLFEGFGMIALEAQAAGRPVVCSSISVLEEVCGDSVIYVNPYDEQSIKNGFQRLIGDEQFRQTLVAKGVVNATRFSPTKIRGQWMQVYDSVQ